MKDTGKTDEWLYANHGSLFHPLEVLSKLGETYLNPVLKYCFFEEKGHIVPVSYRNGQVDTVRLFFPKKFKASDVAKELNITERELISKLGLLLVNDGLREGALGIDAKLTRALEKYLIVKRRNGMVHVGREGRKLLGNNGY